MKKIFLFIAVVSLFSLVNTAFAQSNATTKAAEVSTLLDNSLSLTGTQKPAVTTLVDEYANKYASANAAATPSNLKTQAKTALLNEFSSGLTKVLTPAQATKYNNIKGEVSTIFNTIK